MKSWISRCFFIFFVYTFTPIHTFASLNLFYEPYNGRTPVVQAINEATQSIKMEMYLITDSQVVNALQTQAGKGVNVQVILEQNPYGLPTDEIAQMKQTLEKAGINVKWANSNVFRLTHEKSILVDDKKLLIMTLNQSYSAFTTNREYGIIDTDAQDVKEAGEVFSKDWAYQQATYSDSDLLWSPVNSKDRLLKTIDAASHDLYIETEEIYDPDIENALIAKVKQGINVEMVLPPQEKTTDIQRLSQAGVDVRILDKSKGQLYMHAKLMIADGKLAYIGSENLSTASLTKNRELGIYFSSETQSKKVIIDKLVNIFATDWAAAAPFQMTKSA